jgi:toluene monooxygenase system protein E
MVEATPLRRERKKTWSALAGQKRKPNDYEIVTHNLNHTTGERPLDMGANVRANVWLKTYRDSSGLKVSNWDDFRDPDRVTYDSYVKMQDEQETYIDNLLLSYTEARASDSELSAEALEWLRIAFAPSRYLVHAQQMLSAYVQQLAPSSYVANCAAFQTADQLRRLQRIAYRTKQLDTAHPLHGFGSKERQVWENDARWQPIRRALEELLVVFEWDRAFALTCLVVRPICDRLFLHGLSAVARATDDELDALLLANLYRDSERADRWSVALSRFIIDNDPGNRALLRTMVTAWSGVADRIMEAGTHLFESAAPSAKGLHILEEVRHRSIQIYFDAGLGDA